MVDISVGMGEHQIHQPTKIYILGPALQLSAAEARSATGFDIFGAVMRTPIISEPILLFRIPMECTHIYIYICIDI